MVLKDKYIRKVRLWMNKFSVLKSGKYCYEE